MMSIDKSHIHTHKNIFLRSYEGHNLRRQRAQATLWHCTDHADDIHAQQAHVRRGEQPTPAPCASRPPRVASSTGIQCNNIISRDCQFLTGLLFMTMSDKNQPLRLWLRSHRVPPPCWPRDGRGGVVVPWAPPQARWHWPGLAAKALQSAGRVGRQRGSW